MKIIVCMKQVPDPTASAAGIKVDSEVKRVIPPQGSPPVLSPFDESALEAAIVLKDTLGAEITVISAGFQLAKPVHRKALASGADHMILLEDKTFENLDSYATAHVLATAIREIGEYDLVLCGRQAADTDAGQVGSGVAHILGLPCITAASGLECGDGKVTVERVVSDGYEVVEAPLPVLITASSEIGELRYPSVKELMASQRAPVTVKTAQDLGIDTSQLARVTLVSLTAPPGREGECRMIETETPEEAGAELAVQVKEAQLL